VAAILLQLSWWIFKFAIDVSNDVGTSIANLMFFPFGGTGKFALDNLVAATGVAAPSGTVLGASLITACLIAFSGLTIFGWLLLGLTVALSVFTGYLLLIVRQMLIILCMITVPLALVAWILPGTKKYWDLWKDNFTKLLFMFPMIMAMIAAGRIFALIGSQQGGFTGLIIVLVGVFGPYFYLPKTFKWGGQAFGALSNATWSGTQKWRSAPSKRALDAAKENREQRAMDRAERLANNRGLTFDRIFAGRYNMLRSQTRREHAFQDTLEKGRKAADEEAARAVIGSEYERMDHPDKVATDILVAQGRLDPRTGMDGRHAATQRAALERLAKYGDWDAISQVREGGYMGEEGERVWQDFVAKNIGAIHQNMPHLSPQRTNLSQVAYREFSTMKDDGWDEAWRQAEGGLVRNAVTGLPEASTDPEADRRRWIAKAQEAMNDTQFMATVGAHGREVLQRIADLPVTRDTVEIQPGSRGAPARLHLPDASAFSDPTRTPAAIDSVRQHLVSTDLGTRNAAGQQIGSILADPHLDSNTRDAYENLLSELRIESTHSTQAAAAYNQAINSIHAALTDHVNAAEQQAVASGLTGPALARARNAAMTEASDIRDNLVRNGLIPI